MPIVRLFRRVELPQEPGADLLDAVRRATSDYRAAQVYFESVTETELVDQAIHLVAAAEKKLLYLIRKAREEGVGPAARPAAQRGELGA
jgi:hypothetical protein